MTLTLPQTVQQGTQRGQLNHLHPVRTSLDGTMGEGQHARACVCVRVLVFYHLHRLREDDAVQTDQVLVVQRMHSVHLSDEIIQTVRVQHVSL